MNAPICDTSERSEAYAVAAILANVDRFDESGEPNTLSLDEVRVLGAKLLDLFDGVAVAEAA